MGYFEALEIAARQPLDDEDGLARIEAASQVLRDDYAKSAYTSRGVLVAATALYERGAADQAKEQLRWLIKTDHDSVATGVARLRLAALLLEEGDYAEGLDLLAREDRTRVG